MHIYSSNKHPFHFEHFQNVLLTNLNVSFHDHQDFELYLWHIHMHVHLQIDYDRYSMLIRIPMKILQKKKQNRQIIQS